MLKRLFHSLVACLLMITLLSAGTSHELLHSFMGHEDTVERVYPSGQHVHHLEKGHIHCKFLEMGMPQFLAKLPFLLFFSVLAAFFIYREKQFPLVFRFVGHSFQRGPPASML